MVGQRASGQAKDAATPTYTPAQGSTCLAQLRGEVVGGANERPRKVAVGRQPVNGSRVRAGVLGRRWASARPGTRGPVSATAPPSVSHSLPGDAQVSHASMPLPV